ncbi:hypothetical protein [Jannaschia donghaensis]|uniref:Lipoprotein n=1 Tax=Jannaschia donghaensis TaxID=420998 RepID=A0A0M6YGM2_9RHOB|nr:hypothetical protein [Jannaschia donghaensis]CTQ48929.1 hypothetical protein JDO7802_00937 [Jannaschia donghaensis]
MKSFFVLPAVLALSACVGASTPDYQTSCMFEVSPPGAYSSNLVRGAVSEAVPVYSTGATDAGAAMLNACIRAKAAADGVALALVPG